MTSFFYVTHTDSGRRVLHSTCHSHAKSVPLTSCVALMGCTGCASMMTAFRHHSQFFRVPDLFFFFLAK